MNEARKEALIRKYSYAAQQAGAQGKVPADPGLEAPGREEAVGGCPEASRRMQEKP